VGKGGQLIVTLGVGRSPVSLRELGGVGVEVVVVVVVVWS